MYEVLIAHLRECAKLDPSNNTYAEAASAIEELSNWRAMAMADKLMKTIQMPKEVLTGTDMRGGIRRDDAGNVIDWGITGQPGDVGKTEEEQA